MSREIEVLLEIRDLLQVMAEPALAKRDESFRTAIRLLAGKSEAKCKAVMLMDGMRSQSAIAKESGMDSGNLSRLIKSLSAQTLIASDEKHPRLRFKLPVNFFDQKG
jgi:DNA-binding MarR family transcriptional regulator